jgi:hypothetical protein
VRRHRGVTRDVTLWVIDQGSKMMGIDAWGSDKPFDKMRVLDEGSGHD